MKKWMVLSVVLFLFSSSFLFSDEPAQKEVLSIPSKDSEKLDLILQKLDNIMAELEIVKIRASQR